jgi:hypothetical protein
MIITKLPLMYKCYAPCTHYLSQFSDAAVMVINQYHLKPYTVLFYKLKISCVYINLSLAL